MNYSNATNRITSTGYDGNGNLTHDNGTHVYAWDAEGKLASLDGNSETYDAMGRRVEQSTATGSTEILYAPSGAKLALLNGTTVNKMFVLLPGGATAVYVGTSLSYYRHPDWLGSSRIASTPSQTVYYDGAYAPFGESYNESGSTDRSFTGQNQDLDAFRLYDFPAREHHVIQGRWISPDPAGLFAANPSLPQSWNRYAYVRGNPIGLTDPMGLNADDNPCDPNQNQEEAFGRRFHRNDDDPCDPGGGGDGGDGGDGGGGDVMPPDTPPDDPCIDGGSDDGSMGAESLRPFGDTRVMRKACKPKTCPAGQQWMYNPLKGTWGCDVPNNSATQQVANQVDWYMNHPITACQYLSIFAAELGGLNPKIPGSMIAPDVQQKVAFLWALMAMLGCD